MVEHDMASVQRYHEKPETHHVDNHYADYPRGLFCVKGVEPGEIFGFRRPDMEKFIPGESVRGGFSEHSRATHRLCDRPSLTKEAD